MNERKEQLKAALNTELAREGKLQRAGMRKVKLLQVREKKYEKESPDETYWEIINETDNYWYLLSKYTVYFHSFVSESKGYGSMDRVIAHAVLEHEDGRIFTWEAEDIRFIT